MYGVVQLYGLVFLLGSFTVASLSDLRRMAAQRDFAEVWALFAVVLLVYDIYMLDESMMTTFLLKWALIVLFVLFSTRMINHLTISLMDLAAICAVTSLLEPVQIIAYLVLLAVVKEILGPVLRKFGEGGSFPFLPVVWVTTVILLGLMASGLIDVRNLIPRALS